MSHGCEAVWHGRVVLQEMLGLAQVLRGGVILAVLRRLADRAHVEPGALAWATVEQPQRTHNETNALYCLDSQHWVRLDTG